MKYTFETDDKQEATNMLLCGDVQSLLDDYRTYLRGLCKHGHTFKTTEDALESLYQKFNEYFLELME